MTFPSSFLLILLLSHLFPHSSSALKKLDAEIARVRELSMDLQGKSFVEGDHGQRKELHEVHSGPNPISNSLPQRKWKTKSQKRKTEEEEQEKQSNDGEAEQSLDRFKSGGLEDMMDLKHIGSEDRENAMFYCSNLDTS